MQQPLIAVQMNAPRAPRPPQRLQARLVVAQDVLAAIGLVTGIVIAGLSLWAIIGKYRSNRAQQPPPEG